MSELPVIQPAIQPTSSAPPRNEIEHWEQLFAGDNFYYGSDPGPLARRVVRYHRVLKHGGRALDAGCGEGQDLLYFTQCGYEATGLDFTENGVRKTHQLLRDHGARATVLHGDLRQVALPNEFDVVLAANVLQFLGEDALNCLHKLQSAVAPGGIIGISLFARRPNQSTTEGSLFRLSLLELLDLFAHWQPLEAAQLWQWNTQSGEPQPFVTLIARNLPPIVPLPQETFR